uniref:amidohydrolase family protein n=1 Tax=Candidatus Enterococcus willemsii TaxID=1857215 RepID=UPI00403F3310
MLYDLIIKNGTVIDPSRGIEKKEDIYVYKNKIVSPMLDNNSKINSKKIIDAKGSYVIPGLIENHTHIFYGGSEAGYWPDITLLPQGVTSAIDQGTAGVATFESLYRNIIQNSFMNLKAYLNISSTGIITERYMENIDPAFYDTEMIKTYFEKYNDTLIGLKIRLEDVSCSHLKLKPLEKTLELAEEIGRPVSVHVKKPNVEIPEIAKMLRKDDVWVHMYQLEGRTIFNDKGKIYNELYEAKERGVLFDVASGRSGFSFDMIHRSLKQEFYPDLLGTDLVRFNANEPPLFSLLYTMSIYYNLGFSLKDIIRKCTVLPARLMKMETKIGALESGYQADITILKIKEKKVTFKDKYNGKLRGNYLFVPQATIKNGEIMYRNIEFQ